MAGLFDLLGQATVKEVALNTQGAGDSQGIVCRGLVESLHVPKGLGAILGERPFVQAHGAGLNCPTAFLFLAKRSAAE